MSETLESWPIDEVGIGLMQGYRYKLRSNQIISKMSAGLPKTRLSSHEVLVDHWFTLKLTAAQEFYFRWWVHNKIEKGEAHFLMPLLLSAGIPDTAAKFVSIGDTRPRAGSFVIQCQVVTRGLPSHDVSEAEALSVLANGVESLQA